MKKIKDIRDKIDQIDLTILDLIKKRIQYAMKLKKFKEKHKMPVFDPARENLILKKVKNAAGPPLSKEIVEKIFREIISLTRNAEEKQKVWFLGPEGSFSHKASINFFGKSSDFLSANSITEIFYNVEKDSTAFGIVPVENSMQGTVGETLDCFIDSTLKIIGEVYEYISHCLLAKGKSIADINTLYSHPQAIGQCRGWIRQNLGDVKLIEVESTSKAALLASKNKNSGAIGSDLCGEIYKLNVLERDIQERKNNFTRFLIIGPGLYSPVQGNTKTTILFAVTHKPGSLYSALKGFAEQKINLTKIESRPMKDSPWEYVFFVDFQGSIKGKKTRNAMNLLREYATFVKVLGTYPAGKW